jgi:hypothetical protein
MRADGYTRLNICSGLERLRCTVRPDRVTGAAHCRRRRDGRLEAQYVTLRAFVQSVSSDRRRRSRENVRQPRGTCEHDHSCAHAQRSYMHGTLRTVAYVPPGRGPWWPNDRPRQRRVRASDVRHSVRRPSFLVRPIYVHEPYISVRTAPRRRATVRVLAYSVVRPHYGNRPLDAAVMPHDDDE